MFKILLVRDRGIHQSMNIHFTVGSLTLTVKALLGSLCYELQQEFYSYLHERIVTQQLPGDPSLKKKRTLG